VEDDGRWQLTILLQCLYFSLYIAVFYPPQVEVRCDLTRRIGHVLSNISLVRVFVLG
jgi:hypothetical protein